MLRGDDLPDISRSPLQIVRHSPLYRGDDRHELHPGSIGLVPLAEYPVYVVQYPEQPVAVDILRTASVEDGQRILQLLSGAPPHHVAEIGVHKPVEEILYQLLLTFSLIIMHISREDEFHYRRGEARYVKLCRDTDIPPVLEGRYGPVRVESRRSPLDEGAVHDLAVALLTLTHPACKSDGLISQLDRGRSDRCQRRIHICTLSDIIEAGHIDILAYLDIHIPQHSVHGLRLTVIAADHSISSGIGLDELPCCLYTVGCMITPLYHPVLQAQMIQLHAPAILRQSLLRVSRELRPREHQYPPAVLLVYEIIHDLPDTGSIVIVDGSEPFVFIGYQQGRLVL